VIGVLGSIKKTERLAGQDIQTTEESVKNNHKRRFLTLIGGSLLLMSLGSAGAAEKISLGLGESRVLTISPQTRVSLGNPSLAEVTSIGDHEALVTGRAVGSTHLSYHDPSGQRVTQNLVIGLARPKQAMVEIGVEILEVDAQSALKAGLNWGSLTDTKSIQDSLTVSEGEKPPLQKIGVLERGSVAVGLQMLLDRGKARLLAKPKLTVAGGEEASFLSGGEVPYTSSDKNGSSNVQFKSYGVKLNVEARPESDGFIRTKARAEVSGLDYQNGVTSDGTAVPAIKTRWAETTVRLRSGGTLVLAGLIQDEMQSLRSGLPILSDIPILGALFRTTHLVRKQSELVIFLTPTLIGQAAD
jgi:Flp pilus assembly secretin CpaC